MVHELELLPIVLTQVAIYIFKFFHLMFLFFGQLLDVFPKYPASQFGKYIFCSTSQQYTVYIYELSRVPVPVPKFYNWLLVFLEKVQTTGMNQNFIIHCQYFSCCIYLFPCDIVVICLCPTYRLIMVQYISVFHFVGPQGCYRVLNPKSKRGVTHFLV